MTLEQIKNGFKSGAPFFCAGLTQIPFIFDGQFGINEISFFSNLFIGSVLFGLEYKKLKYTDTPEYREYVELYEEFKMYKELGFKGDFTCSLAYKLCLDSGIFSTKNVKYTLYEDDRDKLIKYCGGRVATGSFCCRHNASLLSDILTKMDGIAPKISVFDYDASEMEITAPNHLVTGVLCGNKRLVVDPTMGIGVVFLFDTEYKGKLTTMVSSSDLRYYMLPSCFSNESDNSRVIKKFMKYEPLTDFDEFSEIQFTALLEAGMYQNEYEAFHEEEKPKILQLARLSEVVASHGKEKVN